MFSVRLGTVVIKVCLFSSIELLDHVEFMRVSILEDYWKLAGSVTVATKELQQQSCGLPKRGNASCESHYD